MLYIMSNIPFLDLQREIIPIKEDIQNVMNTIVFKNTNFILGKELNQFENNFARYTNNKYCIGVANGTDALEIAVQSLDLDDNDEIITQANTYVATCFGITNNNKKLKLVDIDADTYQMDLNELERNITSNTKVIIIVHLTGSCCDMDKLMDIVEKHNLILIEDCAQSHGAYFNDKRLGSYGLISTFSFYPGKNLGAFGDGGAICTSNLALCSRIQKIRNNGSIEKYKHDIMGRNSRLDTLQAAILDLKLNRLDNNNSKRRHNAELYCQLLQNVSNIQLPKIEDKCLPVYHLFIIRAENRDKLKQYLIDNGIGVGIHYPISITKLQCYHNYFDEKYFEDKYPHSQQNSNTIISLPMFPDLTEEEITKICKTIKQFYMLDACF